MEKELGFVVKLDEILGNLEVELRVILDEHQDIFSNEHEQMRELLKTLIITREENKKIGGNLIHPDEFDFRNI